LTINLLLGVAERGKEKLIKTTCDHIILTNLHPRTAVCITVQEMQDGGTVRYYQNKCIFEQNFSLNVWLLPKISYLQLPSMLCALHFLTRVCHCSALLPQ
jgi:hypothetical protein